jgi:hypothetical protein
MPPVGAGRAALGSCLRSRDAEGDGTEGEGAGEEGSEWRSTTHNFVGEHLPNNLLI